MGFLGVSGSWCTLCGLFGGISQEGVLIWWSPMSSAFGVFLRFSSVYGARTVINRAIHAPFQVRSFCQCMILFSKILVYHPKFRLPLSLTPSSLTSSSFIFHINQFRNTRSVTQNLYLFLHSIPIQPWQHHKSHIPIQNGKQYTIKASVSFTHSQHLFLRNK
jgi:hypothetical protein